MAYQFTLTGTYDVTPLDSVVSFGTNITTPINEPIVIARKLDADIDLDVDVPVAVNFGGLTSANIVMLKAVGAKVRARITSADGSQQSIPFDTYVILMSMDTPITAIDLLRTAGVATQVRVFLGETP